MKKVSQQEARVIMLEIMDDINDFCHRNHLRYYLAFGTLLGAVRHRGFIPWDDDLDIMMPRPDYELFVKTYRESGKFLIHSYKDKKPLFYYSKVYDPRTIKIEAGVSYSHIQPLGVDIDVFPLDGCPSTITDIKIHKRKQILDTLYWFRSFAIDDISFRRSRKHPFLGFVLGVLSHVVGNRFLMFSYNEIASKYDYDTSDRVAEYGLKLNIFDKDYLDKIIQLPFEDRSFDAPSNYDSVLRSSYGDYMALPPLSERTTHHQNTIRWKD